MATIEENSKGFQLSSFEIAAREAAAREAAAREAAAREAAAREGDRYRPTLSLPSSSESASLLAFCRRFLLKSSSPSVS